VEANRLKRCSVHLKIEDVEPIIMSKDVVILLGLDAQAQVNVGIDDPFGIN
jgi:hypothetical protein